ncbi:MAG: TldD/PmbA family protein [bacterium]|nr:TldD/PmbA family protein [bacterium]
MEFNNYFVRDIPRREFLARTIKGGIAVAATPALVSQLVSCAGGGGEDVMQVDVSMELLDKAMHKALEKGGDFADIYVESRLSRNITMEESKFKSAVTGISKGAGIRVVSGDKTGYAYTEEITEENLLRAAEIASYVAKEGGGIHPVHFSALQSRDSYITVQLPLNEVADEKRLDVIQRSNQAALDYDSRIKMTSIRYYDEVRARTLVNSEGVYLSDELPLMYYMVQTLSDDGNNRHMGNERLSKHMGFEMFEQEISPEDIAKAAARESIAMLDAQDAPAGKMDIVMQNGWGGVLVHEAVGHPLEGDNIAKKVGAFTGKLGQKVASDKFTMIDDGTLPNQRGTTNFDDEGTQMKRNVLIENGVLIKYMTDVLSAKQLGADRTGNGRRESFRDIPIPRMTNTFIDKGDDDPADILSSTENGIYVQSLSGGSVNSITGSFNFTCREAYIIENGKKTYPVKGATLVGSCLEVISNIDAVGTDLAYGPGNCGKGGQTAECDVGQPTVRIRGMNVGGSRG